MTTAAAPSTDELSKLEAVLEGELKQRKKLAWKPRPYQKAAWGYLQAGGKRAFLLWHRWQG
jgi:hypothetical protein